MHSDGVCVDHEEMAELVDRIRAIAQRAEEFDGGIRRDSDLLAGHAFPGEGADSRQMFAAVQERNLEGQRHSAALVEALRRMANKLEAAKVTYIRADSEVQPSIPECRNPERNERIFV